MALLALLSPLMMTREIRGTAALGASSDPLVKVPVYMKPKQRQRLREQAAKAGMSMSAYVNSLIDQAAKQ